MEPNMPSEELIERYVSGRMSANERFDFEKRMEKDDALAEEVRTTLKMKAFFQQMKEEDAFKKKIESIHEEVINDEKVKHLGRSPVYKKIWYAAASVVVLFGVSYLLFFQGPDYQDIAIGGIEDFYGTSRPVMDANAKYYFLNREYSKSLDLTQKEIAEASSDSIRAELIVIKALCETALGNAEASIRVLQENALLLEENYEKCTVDLAKAIALIRLKKIEKSKIILKNISGDGVCADFEERAQKLLTNLD